jgi:hypothetical protein
MTPEATYTIVCPGCGWAGKEEDLVDSAGFLDCPECGYENGFEPYRLLTVKEMLQFPLGGHYHDVNMFEFLNAIKPFLQDVDPNPIPERWEK